MLSALGRWVLAWSAQSRPWTNVVGLARTLLALGTTLTLAFNDTGLLLRPAAGIPDVPRCDGVRQLGAFCLAPAHLGVVRWLAVILLLVAASGWRPRITALPHWWIAFSFQANAILIDGGDHVTTILTLLLVPVALSDPRRWHWDNDAAAAAPGHRIYARTAAAVTLVVIRVQVAAIYLDAAITKFPVREWADGTVLYYWFGDPVFGLPRWLERAGNAVVTRPAVAVATWSILLLEVVLAMGLVMDKRFRPYLLVSGVLLHTGIAFVHGLPTFGLAMASALILYLRAPERPFALGRASARATRARYEGDAGLSERALGTSAPT